MHTIADSAVRMGVRLVAPPPGVVFAIQRGRSDLLFPLDAASGATTFRFAVRLGAPLKDGSFNFLGEFTQGVPTDRFVYINSGARAGQAESPWDRRAKLKLASIPRNLVEAAVGSTTRTVEAAIMAVMPDGGPICATVKPHAVTWTLVDRIP